jgi:hypothetical protein
MSAPSKARNFQLVQIQPAQRLATRAEPILVLVEVTKQVKPRGGMNQAATQVNVLSPVMYNVVEADAFHRDGRQHQYRRDGKFVLTLPGSEAVA